MAELQSSLPLVNLGSGERIVIEAIDPTTGAQVGGVTFSGVAITYDPGAVESDLRTPPPPLLVRDTIGVR